MRRITLALLVATRATATIAFLVSKIPLKQRLIIRSYQNGEVSTETPLPQPAPILPRVNDDNTVDLLAPSTQLRSSDAVEPKLVLPPSLPVVANNKVNNNKKTTSSLFASLNLSKRWQFFQKWRMRPGVKFRLALGIVTSVILAVTSVCTKTRILALTKNWISHRGFTGIAALGRSVAYIWALLVGYPRVLDRRANERKRQQREKTLERRRDQLNRLASEVARLRQELASLDTELRAFRREIISLKAYAKTDDCEDIQKAINTEMGHLVQLRSDTKAALEAARQSWAELRSKSPPEIWDDTLLPHY